MVVTDLDGTLLDRESRLSAVNRAALVRLGERGILRVAATGRSLYSARRVLTPDDPFDYVAVSSGAGIVHWPRAKLVRTLPMAADDTARVCAVFEALALDFMVHAPVPSSHRFVYRRGAVPNPDFDRRLARYAEHCTLADDTPARWQRPACHVVAIHPEGEQAHREVVAQLGEAFSVVRTTSPLDARSVWIEVLPRAASKSQACAWVATEHDAVADQVVAVGNDTNDLDMLAWAGTSYVVANATAAMRDRWTTVGAHDADGFAEVVRRTLG